MGSANSSFLLIAYNTVISSLSQISDIKIAKYALFPAMRAGRVLDLIPSDTRTGQMVKQSSLAAHSTLVRSRTCPDLYLELKDMFWVMEVAGEARRYSQKLVIGRSAA